MAKSKLPRAALYTRVSTLDQSTSMQQAELEEFSKRRGWTVTHYTDEGVSGSKDRRPGLDRLMNDARRRLIDVVVVWKFDRFARSVSHLLSALETFSAVGVQFVSLSESIDTSTPAGKMVFTVLGAVAELERSLIAERVRAGLRNARRQGKHIGRPRVIADSAKIARLRVAGRSWKAIATELGLKPTMVRNRFLALSKSPSGSELLSA